MAAVAGRGGGYLPIGLLGGEAVGPWHGLEDANEAVRLILHDLAEGPHETRLLLRELVQRICEDEVRLERRSNRK